MSNYLTDRRIIAVSRPDKRINLFIQGGTSSSFVLPKDVTAIEEYAFHNISGLAEVVFTNQDAVVEVDGNSGIPANAKFIVPAKFLSDYQAKYPNRTVETRGVIWTVPYVGNSTLTAVYINQCIMQEPEIVNAEVVIIPVEFTSYESGAFSAISSNLQSMIKLEWQCEVTYNATQFKALFSETLPDKVIFSGMTLSNPSTIFSELGLDVGGVKEITIKRINGYSAWNRAGMMRGNFLEKFVVSDGILGSFNGFFIDAYYGTPNLAHVDFGDDLGLTSFPQVFVGSGQELDMRIKGLKINASIPTNTYDSLMYIINNLYDYSGGTQHTLTVGATNLAKLTEEDKQIAYDKNWQLA